MIRKLPLQTHEIFIFLDEYFSRRKKLSNIASLHQTSSFLFMQDDDVVLHQKFNFISFFVSSALLSFSLTKCTTRLLISANFSRNFLFKSYEMKQNVISAGVETGTRAIVYFRRIFCLAVSFFFPSTCDSFLFFSFVDSRVVFRKFEIEVIGCNILSDIRKESCQVM